MAAQLESNDNDVVPALKEAFETGRSVSICIPGRDEPVSGCVSHIIEASGLDGYLFSAFVGDQRVMIKGAPAAIGERSGAQAMRTRGAAPPSAAGGPPVPCS